MHSLIKMLSAVVQPVVSRSTCDCTACDAHLFKSSTGNDACRACPRDSDTDKMASVECRCRRSFYRSPSESADTPCTRLFYDCVNTTVTAAVAAVIVGKQACVRAAVPTAQTVTEVPC